MKECSTKQFLKPEQSLVTVDHLPVCWLSALQKVGAESKAKHTQVRLGHGVPPPTQNACKMMHSVGLYPEQKIAHLNFKAVRVESASDGSTRDMHEAGVGAISFCTGPYVASAVYTCMHNAACA